MPIWRDPWMVVGPGTFSSDMLDRLGFDNVFDDGEDPYPHADIAEIESRNPEVVLLPDEPYVFTSDDGPGALTVPTSLISGRFLTWYGPSMLDAARELSAGELGLRAPALPSGRRQGSAGRFLVCAESNLGDRAVEQILVEEV